MYKYAKENKIPLVMGGNNIGNSSFEQEHWKTGFLGVFPDNRGMYSTYDKIKLTFLLGFEYLRNSSNLHIPILKEYLEGASVYFFESLLKPKGVDSLGFYDYIYWNEKEIVATITKELDWKGASDATTTWRIDDAAYPLMNYMYYKLVGFTEHDEMYSKMIREGQIARDEALERCLADHESRWIHGSRLLGILEELKVRKEEVDEVLEGYREELMKKILGKQRK
jgi:predicted mannosyl-3-phosphoglycerate phosphatase (HAD superfamily)